MSEYCRNSFIMLGRAFCGNGLIHLNIAEIYEGDIGARKSRLRSAIRAQNEGLLVRVSIAPSIFLRQIIGCRVSCRSV